MTGAHWYWFVFWTFRQLISSLPFRLYSFILLKYTRASLGVLYERFCVSYQFCWCHRGNCNTQAEKFGFISKITSETKVQIICWILVGSLVRICTRQVLRKFPFRHFCIEFQPCYPNYFNLMHKICYHKYIRFVVNNNTEEVLLFINMERLSILHDNLTLISNTRETCVSNWRPPWSVTSFAHWTCENMGLRNYMSEQYRGVTEKSCNHHYRDVGKPISLSLNRDMSRNIASQSTVFHTSGFWSIKSIY